LVHSHSGLLGILARLYGLLCCLSQCLRFDLYYLRYVFVLISSLVPQIANVLLFTFLPFRSAKADYFLIGSLLRLPSAAYSATRKSKTRLSHWSWSCPALIRCECISASHKSQFEVCKKTNRNISTASSSTKYPGLRRLPTIYRPGY
jgi:hypothetical protein